jgi:hypothetical protein
VKLRILVLLALLCAALSAQVYPDFPRTIPPIQAGSGLPVHCQSGRGEVFLNTADLKFYLCTLTDTWTPTTGSSGGGGGSGVGSPSWTVTDLGNISGAVTLHVGSTQQIFTGIMIGNVTVTAADAGSSAFALAFAQDSTGGRTLTCDSSFAGCGIVDPAVSAVCYQSFAWIGTAGTAKPMGDMACPGGTTGIITSAGVLSLPTAPETLLARATADTLTNKTIDTANNTLKIAGTTVTGKQGNTGVLQTAGAVSGAAGTALCTDASGNTTTTGCTAGGGSVAAGTGISVSGSTVSFNPLDRSMFWLIEEFMPSGNYPGGTNFVGTHRWGLDNITGGTGGCGQVVQANGGTNTPGSLTLIISGSGANSGCSIALDNNNNNLLFTNWSAKPFEAQWTMLPDIASTAFVARFGMGGTSYTPASISSVECHIDPSVSANYTFNLYTTGTLTGSADSGVAFAVDGNLHTCRIRGDGSKFYFSVATNAGAYSTEKTLCASGCDITAALPTFGMTPFASLLATDTGTKRFYLDRFALVATGLVR